MEAFPDKIYQYEKRDDDLFYQWDYPTMWGNFVYLTYLGLKNVGLNEDANLSCN